MHVCELKARRSGRTVEDSEGRLLTTLELLPVGIAHLDIAGRWQVVNIRFCELLGYDRSELLTLAPDRVLEMDPQLATDQLSRERRQRRTNDDVVWIRLSVWRVRDDSGQTRYFLVTAEDISAQKGAEAAIGIAAHELRLPLSHIKGFISTLRRPDTIANGTIQRDFLAEAERETNRLERLIENLLDHSTGRPLVRPRRTTILPRALVLTTLSRLRPMLAERRIRVDVPVDLPPILVEIPAIERVVANLLLNAGKYSPPGAAIDVSANLAGNMLELHVEDRGPGVPPEEAERIFEPFYRRTLTAGDSNVGHGLGLAIARSIVIDHGGRIWVAPRVGGGASFSVALPVSSPRSRRLPRGGVRECGRPPTHPRPRTLAGLVAPSVS
jgi:PAS domain S-box-containing protein